MSETKLKAVIDEMVKNGFHIRYESFMLFWKAGKINKTSSDLIISKKKVNNYSYFLKDSDIDKFKESLLQQFNN